eukprot:6184669-Pyramimonas_sp.AAC.1
MSPTRSTRAVMRAQMRHASATPAPYLLTTRTRAHTTVARFASAALVNPQPGEDTNTLPVPGSAT